MLMKKKVTFEEFLDLLNPVIKEKFLVNIRPSTNRNNIQWPHSWIDNSMTWSNTPEGEHYWNAVYERMYNLYYER